MQHTDLFAFYGSLRRGMSNYLSFQNSLEFISSARIAGYEMYSLQEYPYAIKCNNLKQTIVVDLFRINNAEIRMEIHKMEIEAGYFRDIINLKEGKATIYLFQHKGNDFKVKSGDWVEFFGGK